MVVVGGVIVVVVVVIVVVEVLNTCVIICADGLYFSTNAPPTLPESIAAFISSCISLAILASLVKLLLLARKEVITSSRMNKSRLATMLPSLQVK